MNMQLKRKSIQENLNTPLPGDIKNTFHTLKYAGFRLYLFGLIVSLMGTYMQQVAEGWLVYQLTDSAFTLGLVGFVAMVPTVPWILFAGVIADRIPKRKLLAIVQAAQVFPPLLLAFLTWTGRVQVWHVLGIEILMGFLSSVDQPTRQALVAEIVGTEDLRNAFALTAASINMARVVGPAIAGVIISTIGLSGAFMVNGISFLAVLLALLVMKLPPQEISTRKASVGADLMEGIRYLFTERTIQVLIILMIIVSFFILPYQTLLPVFARDILHAGATGLGFLTSAAGLGAIVGSLSIVKSSPKTWMKWVICLLLIIPIFAIAFSFSTQLTISCLLLVCVSGGVVALKTLGFTQVQIHTRDELRGRITSMLLLTMGATPRIGGLVAGYLAGPVGATTTLALFAFVCLIGSLLMLLAFVRYGFVNQVST